MKKPVFNSNWSEDVKTLYANDMREIWDKAIELQSYYLYQNQLDFYFSLIKKLNPKTILDIGCAQATLAMRLAEQGKRVCAVDIRSQFLEYAKSRYEKGDISFQCANIMDRPDLGRYDLVIANQIIEHLVYPVDFLKILKQYTNPRGFIVVTTPNHDYFRCHLPSYLKIGDPAEYEKKQNSATGGDHFYAYKKEELKACFRQSGINALEVIFFETPWISGHVKFRYLQKFLPLQFLKFMDRLTLAIASRWMGQQLCVIGRVP